MRILFIFPNTGSGYCFHPGIQILSALAKKEGHATGLIHLHEVYGTPNDPELIAEKAKRFNPDIIAFTASDFEYKMVDALAHALKKTFPKTFFLLGGKSAILGKDFENSAFDAFCVGEAEIPFMQLVEKLEKKEDFTTVRSMWFKKDGRIIKNPLGDIITNLDLLPFMDYDIFDTKKLLEVRSHWLSVQFSRGCAYNCTYCFVTADKKVMFSSEGGYGMKNYLRRHSIDYVIAFLESLCKKYKIEVFNLDDELPVMYKEWIFEFCSKYKERIYGVYGSQYCLNGRIDLMTEDLIKALAGSGCREIRMGFESGNFGIRKEILDKPITDEKMKEVYDLCDKHGLAATSFTMIGVPTETHETIMDTIRMTAALKPYLIRLTFCYPFQDTRLWELVMQRDLLMKEKYMAQSGYFEESPLKWDGQLTDAHLMAYRYLFPWHVNTILLKDQKLAEKYRQMIEFYKSANFKSSEVLREVINADSRLSEMCGEMEHFCYFNKNTAYFHCKNKKYKVVPIEKEKEVLQ